VIGSRGRRIVSRASGYLSRLKLPTFREFADSFMREYAEVSIRSKPSGLRAKENILRNHVLPVVGDLPLDKIDERHVLALKQRTHNLSPKTANNILTTLTGALRWAVRRGLLPEMPVRVELFRAPEPEMQFYDFETYARIRQAAQQLDPRFYAMVLLGGDAGLRLSEIVALRWVDVNFQTGTLNVRVSDWKGTLVVPKSGTGRVVPMTELLALALRALRKSRHGRVLARDDGNPTSMQTVRTWMRHVQETAGIEGAKGNLHVLRHTFCSHLAIRGAAPVAIQKLAGHTSHKVTQRYLHLGVEERREAIRLLDASRKTEEAVSLSSFLTSPAGFEPFMGAKKRRSRTEGRSKKRKR